MESIELAVNGTLMRGLALNGNLLVAGGRFVSESATAPCYRMWSIDDDHPGMMRANCGGGGPIALEIWALPPAGIVAVLLQEPAGLCIGCIDLEDGRQVLGVLAEPVLCEGQKEITGWGGWRAYVASLSAAS